MEKCLREVKGKKGTIRKYLLLLRIVDNILGSLIIGNLKIGCKSIFGLCKYYKNSLFRIMEKESQENIYNPKIIDNNMNLNANGFNY